MAGRAKQTVCCKTDEKDIFGWCENEAHEKREIDGKYFCIFHAPIEYKEDYDSNIDECIDNKIKEHIESNSTCNFAGSTLKNFDIGKDNTKTINVDVNLTGVEIIENVLLGDIEFAGDVILEHAIFHKSVILNGSIIAGKLDCSLSQFRNGIFLKKAIVKGEAIFMSAKFNVWHDDGGKLQIKGSSVFEEVIFEKWVNLKNVEFGFVKFDLGEFKDTVDVHNSKFHSVVSFNGVRFNKTVEFLGVVFEKKVGFVKTQFNSNTTFGVFRYEPNDEITRENITVFKNKSVFKWARFYETAFIDHVKFGFNEEEVIEYETDFSQVNIAKNLVFDSVGISKMLLSDTNVSRIDFINSPPPKLDDGREVFYDELKLENDKKNINDMSHVDYITDKKYMEKLKKIEILYRKFKEKHVREHNWPEVSNHHYNEKSVALKRYYLKIFKKPEVGQENFYKDCKLWIDNFIKFIFYRLYKFLSGFNESPMQTVKVLLFMLMALGSIVDGSINILSALWWKTVIDVTEFLPFVNTSDIDSNVFTDISGWWKFGVVFMQMFITIQIALLIMSVRNKLRR